MQLVEGVRTIRTMSNHTVMNMWPHLILETKPIISLNIKYIRVALGYWIQFLVHIMHNIVSIILALGEAKGVCSSLEGCHDLRG
jgi:hypothetical protein